jgi:hypothetical protein
MTATSSYRGSCAGHSSDSLGAVRWAACPGVTRGRETTARMSATAVVVSIDRSVAYEV